MKINWSPKINFSQIELEAKLKFEYNFKKRIHLFVLKERSLNDCIGDELSSLVFDYNPSENKINISPKTPEPIFSKFMKLWPQFLASSSTNAKTENLQ